MERVEVPLADHLAGRATIFIGRDRQVMPRDTCVRCGRVFWTVPVVDRGQCPKCQSTK